jgi:predicted ester cyclase
MASDANKIRSRRLYEEVFGRGNLEAADEILAEGCVSHGPGVAPIVGRDQIKRQAMLLRTAIPDLHPILHAQLADGELVASRWTGEGTHTGPMMSPAGTVEPTGRPIAFDEIRIDRHVDGRIVESWFIPDRLALWQQLGILPSS